ncbi:MAG: DUF4339 domain-containing protein [Chlamydiae bacterium]|nr:DUF4339 domain-containing protein [Chlamydiota bacterium]
MTLPFSPLTLIIAFFTGLLGLYFARKRGRNPYAWFFIGFFFGVLGVMVIFFAPNPKKKSASVAETPKEVPLPTIQGPSDKFWYYLDPTHQQIGPMSFEALKTAWQDGKVSLTTYVWHEELPEWKLLKDCVTSSP